VFNETRGVPLRTWFEALSSKVGHWIIGLMHGTDFYNT